MPEGHTRRRVRRSERHQASLPLVCQEHRVRPDRLGLQDQSDRQGPQVQLERLDLQGLRVQLELSALRGRRGLQGQLVRQVAMRLRPQQPDSLNRPLVDLSMS